MALTLAAWNELKKAKKKGGALLKIPKGFSERAIVLKEDKSRNFTERVQILSFKTTKELEEIFANRDATKDIFLAINYVIYNF